jgi:hypothetical protein
MNAKFVKVVRSPRNKFAQWRMHGFILAMTVAAASHAVIVGLP